MGKECDACDRLDYTDENPRVFICQVRPSDRAEMCCVLAGHKQCLAAGDELPSIGSRGGVATGKQWGDWIEGPKAREDGFLFLTL